MNSGKHWFGGCEYSNNSMNDWTIEISQPAKAGIHWLSITAAERRRSLILRMMIVSISPNFHTFLKLAAQCNRKSTCKSAAHKRACHSIDVSVAPDLVCKKLTEVWTPFTADEYDDKTRDGPQSSKGGRRRKRRRKFRGGKKIKAV